MEKIINDSQSHAASFERTGRKDCLKTGSSSELVNKLREQACPASRKLSGGEAIQNHQEDDTVKRGCFQNHQGHRADKESDLQEKINKVS